MAMIQDMPRENVPPSNLAREQLQARLVHQRNELATLDKIVDDEQKNVSTIINGIPQLQTNQQNITTALAISRENLVAIITSREGIKRMVRCAEDITDPQPASSNKANNLIEAASSEQLQYLEQQKDKLELNISQFVASLSTLKSDLYGMRVTLAFSQTSLGSYIKRREETLCMIQELRSQLSPVRRMPNEIWHEIFRICIEPASVEGKQAQLLIITHVCRDWRETTLQSSGLGFLPYRHRTRAVVSRRKGTSQIALGVAILCVALAASSSLIKSTNSSLHLYDSHNETAARLQSVNNDTHYLSKILPPQHETPTTTVSDSIPRSQSEISAQSTSVILSSQYQDLHAKGLLAFGQKRYADAEGILTETLVGRRGILGNQHDDTLSTLCLLGRSIYNQGRRADAEVTFKEALAGQRSVLGSQHKKTLDTLHWLGHSIYSQARYTDAEGIFKEALAGWQSVLGDRHTKTLETLYYLGYSVYGQQRYADAEAAFKEVLAGRRRLLGDHHEATLDASYGLGLSLHRQRRYVDAEVVLKDLMALARGAHGDQHEFTLKVLKALSNTNLHIKRH